MQTIVANCAVILAAYFGILRKADASSAIHAVQYAKCAKVVNTGHISHSAIPGRSPLDCIQQCSQIAGCSGVNVCRPGPSGRVVTCWLTEDVLSGPCDSLATTEASSCYYAQKV